MTAAIIGSASAALAELRFGGVAQRRSAGMV
jgi:hypothetical protein